MANVTIRPVQNVTVRVNQGHQQTVTGTSTFVGSGLAQRVTAVSSTANTALSATTGEIPGKFDGGDF